MVRPPRVVAVEYLGNHQLRLTFSDGLVRELDFAGRLRGDVFAALNDPAYFAQAGLDPVAGTVCWPNGVDLDPDVLHGDHPPASGSAARLLHEHRLRPTA